MNDLHLRLRATLWWLLPLAALIVLVGFETDWGSGLRRRAAPEEPAVAKPVAVGVLPEYTIEGGIAKHSETINRTLFNPTRRPAPVAVVEVAKPVMKRGQFALTGTTVAGERSLAFLKEISGGKARTVKMGDTINGLVVAEVKPDRVKLTLGDETEELVLRVAANPKTTPQPAATAQAQPGAQQVAAGQQPAHPPGTGAPTQEVPVNESSLAERRRAARAAAAAAAAQSETNPPQPPPAVPPPQSGAAGTAAQPDTGWAAMYQRYQQRKN